MTKEHQEILPLYHQKQAWGFVPAARARVGILSSDPEIQFYRAGIDGFIDGRQYRPDLIHETATGVEIPVPRIHAQGAVSDVGQ
ncbi:hypothetical protein WBW39_15050 [Pectobacterium versatile]|uniref:hypothetical protein n=1 Tax=Pectobacterium versatile TaxID=2488639 RepID=UPI00301AC748